MIWCLSEAMRDEERNMLRKVASVTIIRDESKGKLILRFIASTHKAKVFKGHLGVISDFGTGAINIDKAIKKAFEEWFTIGLGAPPRKEGCEDAGSIDTSLYLKVQSKVEFFVADSASDENLAGKLARHGSCALSIPPVFPNIKHLAWDKAHGARRTANVALTGACMCMLVHGTHVCMYSRACIPRVPYARPSQWERNRGRRMHKHTKVGVGVW
jgi:hypothetical protein